MSTNARLAAVLEEISKFMDLLGEDAFRSGAHARAARAIEGLPQDIATLAKDREAVLAIEGIGPKLADKIVEFVKSGRIAEHAELAGKIPPGLLPLLSVPGLGPKTVRMLWQQGGVTDRASLDKIIADGSILQLPRMGEKAVAKIKSSLAFTGAGQGAQRVHVGRALPLAERVVERLSKLPGVKHAAYAGSLRRGRETVGDVDVLVAVDEKVEGSGAEVRVGEVFRAMPEVREVLAAGDTRSSVMAGVTVAEEKTDPADAPAGAATAGGPVMQMDLRIVPLESWGAALLYFTGSKDHNVELRQRALSMGLTLNEYGLFPEDKEPTPPQQRGVKPVAGRTEESVYQALGLPWLPPEVREQRGETGLKSTPRLIEVSDVRAELHAHTTASDGSLEIAELAELYRSRGFHTIAVTDHSRSATIANGLSTDRLRKHVEDIARARSVVKGITILAGSEVDILADGSLDYPDSVLALLDVIVASPHVALSQDPEAATRRLVAAVTHPRVHILGHPTGRLINRRPGLEPDMDAVIAAAKEHRTALEINAHWMRLDLRDTHVRRAVDAGCLIAIDCDTHAPEDADNLRYGVMTARRGWVTPERCVNAWEQPRLLEWLASKRGGGGSPVTVATGGAVSEQKPEARASRAATKAGKDTPAARKSTRRRAAE